MKGVVKIGFTRGQVRNRAKEISIGTGVPMPYEVDHFHITEDVELVEQAIHAKLSSHRINENREFFSVSVSEAIKAISELVKIPEISFTAAKNQRTCKRCGHKFMISGAYSLCPSCGF